MKTPAPAVSIPNLFFVFLRIGLLSFGGGLSGWIFREVVTTRHWIDEEEFLSGLAVSQILPGTNVSNLAVFIGNKLNGPLGAIAALTGLIAGPFFAVIGVATVYGVIKALPLAEAGLDGVTAAALGLILIVVAKGARRAAQRIEAMIALAVTFIAVGLLHWSLLAVALVVGPISVAAAWLRVRADAR